MKLQPSEIFRAFEDLSEIAGIPVASSPNYKKFKAASLSHAREGVGDEALQHVLSEFARTFGIPFGAGVRRASHPRADSPSWEATVKVWRKLRAVLIVRESKFWFFDRFTEEGGAEFVSGPSTGNQDVLVLSQNETISQANAGYMFIPERKT